MLYPRRTSIRLPLQRYADQGSIWHVTLTTSQRRPWFNNRSLGTAIVDSLKTASQNGKASLLLFCLMPEHLHAIIQIEESDLISILRNFKSFTTRIWWKQGGAGALWQRSAYDRGHRESETMDDLLAYVFNNPMTEDEIEGLIQCGMIGGSLLENDN